jgi:hypothetical protein
VSEDEREGCLFVFVVVPNEGGSMSLTDGSLVSVSDRETATSSLSHSWCAVCE